MDAVEIKSAVRDYIISEFLPGEDPNAIGDSLELRTQGILDSLATLKLSSFLEERYHITLEAHEVGSEYLNTLNDIATLVLAKLDQREKR